MRTDELTEWELDLARRERELEAARDRLERLLDEKVESLAQALRVIGRAFPGGVYLAPDERLAGGGATLH